MTETDPFEGLRAILAEPNPLLGSEYPPPPYENDAYFRTSKPRVPWVRWHERFDGPHDGYSLDSDLRRPRVRYFDRNWNRITERQLGDDLSACTLPVAVKDRPEWWGWATTDPHRDIPIQWPRQFDRRTVTHGPTTFAVLAYIAKKQREDLIANGVEPSLWMNVAGRYYVGGWWMTPEAIVEDETRQRLAAQARTALAGQ